MEGEHQASASVSSFQRPCEAACKFYEKYLDSKIQAMIPHEGTPAPEHVLAEWRSKIMHASVVVGDQVLMGCDAPPDRFQKPQGFSVSIQIKKPAEAERIFGALAEQGRVAMPVQEYSGRSDLAWSSTASVFLGW
jgi:PhnB protein